MLEEELAEVFKFWKRSSYTIGLVLSRIGKTGFCVKEGEGLFLVIGGKLLRGRVRIY